MQTQASMYSTMLMSRTLYNNAGREEDSARVAPGNDTMASQDQ